MAVLIADILFLGHHCILEAWETDTCPSVSEARRATPGLDADHQGVDFELDAIGCFGLMLWW